MKSSANSALVIALVTGGIGSTARATTVITFEGLTDSNLDISSLPGFGDNVSADSANYTVSLGQIEIGTPGITLDWLSDGWDTYTGWDGRGSVAQTDFNSATPMSILFTPEAGSAVRLISFDLDEWAGGDAGQMNWTLTGPNSGTLSSGSWNMTTVGGRTTILLPTGGTGQLDEPITLTFSLASGRPSYFALDNLTFDQLLTVPEPSTLLLSGAALGAMAMRRRRKQA